MAQITEKVDVCVIGAGHAGCEAALACARMGLETVIFTVSIESIALMPCNPNIGGSSKGHLVRELDALGGEMGKNIDHTFIQSKMLNASKGPAVHSLRAQADKAEYSRRMRQILENQEHLVIKQAEVCDLLWDDVNADTVSEKAGATKKIRGVRTFTGTVYEAKAVILCTGTYLKARCLCGESITYTGPNGLQAANHLTDSLKEMGIEMRRFKTGTPARMDKRSIDFSKMEEQFGDPRVVPFSFSTDPESVQIDQDSCWLTYTNEKTHEIIRANLDRSPEALFPRIDVKKEIEYLEAEDAKQKAAAEAAAAPKAEEKKEEAVAEITDHEPEISFDDFCKVELRVAEVRACENMKESKKLLHLTVFDGERERCILSGIAKWYKPEDLIGKKIAIVANLAPRPMMKGKYTSEGMIVAADTADGGCEIAFYSDNVPTGTRVH